MVSRPPSRPLPTSFRGNCTPTPSPTPLTTVMSCASTLITTSRKARTCPSKLLVYQEDVMFAAQRLAGYSPGGADLLRRAMGKKKKEILDKEYEPFAAGMK